MTTVQRVTDPERWKYSARYSAYTTKDNKTSGKENSNGKDQADFVLPPIPGTPINPGLKLFNNVCFKKIWLQLKMRNHQRLGVVIQRWIRGSGSPSNPAFSSSSLEWWLPTLSCRSWHWTKHVGLMLNTQVKWAIEAGELWRAAEIGSRPTKFLELRKQACFEEKHNRHLQ